MITLYGESYFQGYKITSLSRNQQVCFPLAFSLFQGLFFVPVCE